ncbi:hypothetical protein [Streptomyces sp. HC307]|uniref:hypothetical protein n=1 Tax=Streptomyces flavusporus TaxID=3385496 RepID=UPI003916DE6A
MNQRTRITLFTPLMVGSLALGPAAASAWGHAPEAAPTQTCFVEAKAGDATKVTVTGEGFKKGKAFLDQTDGQGGGSATVGDDGKFASGELPAGNYRAFQEGGASANCLGGQAAQEAVDKKLIDSERKRGAREGFADGRELAQSGACDAEPKPQERQRLAPSTEAQKAAQEAYKNAYSTAFNSAIDRFC